MLSAQATEKNSYEAVVRNLNGVIVIIQYVGMKITILKYTNKGNIALYKEAQTLILNENGLISIQIGKGMVVLGVFAKI